MSGQSMQPRALLRALAACGLLATTVLPAAVNACGDVVPLRGGVVAPAGEHSVELVRLPGGRWIVHVDDHGRPVRVDQAEGTLDVARAGHPVRVHALQPGPTNTLSTGTDDLATGDRLQLVVQLPDGQVVWTQMTMSEPAPSFATRFLSVQPAPR